MRVFFKKITLILFVFSMGFTTVHSASFNCDKATLAVEFAICGNEQLSSMDESLSLEYRQAVLHNPTIKKIQQSWLRGPRENCDSQVECLIGAYQKQLDILRNINSQHGVKDLSSVAMPISTALPMSTSDRGNEIQEPKLSADNPIPILFDTSLIHNSSTLLSEAYWSNPQNNLFGKPIIQWTETDFSYVVFRLNKEMDADLASTRSFYLKRNLKTKPEDDSVYQARVRDIRIFIENIPRFKYWIQQANVKLKEQEYLQQQKLSIENQKKVEKDKEKEIANLENKRKHIAQSELNRANTIKILAFLSVVAVFAIYIWNKFIRKRCSRCKSLNFVVHDITELERFKGYVKVQEKNSRGVNTRAVSATLTINEYDYRCKDCGHQWFEKKKEELGANL